MDKQEIQVPQVPRLAESAGRPMFGRWAVVGLIAGTVILLGIGNIATWVIQRWAEGRWGVPVDRPRAWPLSVFSVRVPTGPELAIAGGVLGLFLVCRWWLSRGSFRLRYVIAAGLALVIGTNLVQGWQNGLVTPTSGTVGHWKGNLADPLHTAAHLSEAELTSPLQYYDDARNVQNAREFLGRFHEIQPGLLTHSQTHPPGAVLLFWGLQRLAGSPAAISAAIAIFSTVLSGLFFYGLLRTLQLEQPLAGYMTFLLLLLPAVQIYYAASLDAVIATLLLGGLCLFVQRQAAVAVGGAGVLLIGVSFLTFGWVFALPVLAGWEWLRHRRLWRFVGVCAVVGLFYVGLWAGTGFDYLRAFRTASAIENPGGFYLLAQPVSYLLTRLECVAEILAFAGPFLVVVIGQGLRCGSQTRGLSAIATFHGRRQRGHGTQDGHDTQDGYGIQAQLLFWLGIGTLAAMFAAGAFRTGETARACLFAWPYLLLAVGLYLRDCQISDKARRQLLSLVFLQGLAMQTFASFFW